jgi:POTRA domain, FtsQ-type
MSGLQTRDRPEVLGPDELPIDPRIVARWVSVRRDESRRRRRWAMGVLAAVSAVVGIWMLAHSSVLSVRRVVVRGTSHTTRASVMTAARVDHRPMVDVDQDAVRRRIGALPWIASVTVHRHWPATVTLDVVERVPSAQTDGIAGQSAIVDATGRVLAEGPDAAAVIAAARPALPVLRGAAPVGVPGSTLTPVAREALTVLAALVSSPSRPGPGGAGFTVTSVTTEADGTISTALAPGPVNAVFGTTDQLDAKVLALRTVLAQATPGAIGGGATIDVRVADAPVLTNGVLTDGKKSSSVSTTQRG